MEGAGPAPVSAPADDPTTTVEDALRELLAGGATERDAVRQAAARLRRPRREVYAAALALKRRTECGAIENDA
jgi:hypothetical protein